MTDTPNSSALIVGAGLGIGAFLARQSAASHDHVAIIGGGFSGTLLAVNLLREEGPRATLIERRPHTARGVAYSAAHPDHLLNVRAENMSALEDQPDHFIRWLERHRPGLHGFVPRLVYGDYLDDLLAETVAGSNRRLQVVRGEASDIHDHGPGVVVRLANGAAVRADSAVLAPGNLPPHAPPGLDPSLLPAGRYIADPWHGHIGSDLEPDDTVLVLGTGLTMVDVALLLDAQGFRGRLVALSRRGLVPHAHADDVPRTVRTEQPEPTARGLLQTLRDRAAEIEWRAAVDELRPHTQGIWQAMSVTERRRFLRHLRPWWDVHRHRLAPSVAARIEAMREGGRLVILAGRVAGVEVDGGHVRFHYRPRQGQRVEALRVRRIINGTGPQGDLIAATEPLLRNLARRGVLRPDPLRIGIDVDQYARALDIDGSPSDKLTVIGPMTRGAFWEMVAVPDIRHQAWTVARRLGTARQTVAEGV